MSVFSDDVVIRRLSKDFVPVLLDTHEVQNGRTPTRDWFMKVAVQVKPDITKGITAQGRYVIAADGTAYGFNNNRDVDRILRLLDLGEGKFKANPPTSVPIALDDAYGNFPAADTTVVRIFSRIRPVPENCSPSNKNVARDHFWIYGSEATEIRAGRLPDSVVNRLCRFQLFDNIRGEPEAWQPGEISRRDFKLVKRADGSLKLTGDFAMETGNGARALRGHLDGDIRFIGTKMEFRAFVKSTARGSGRYTPNAPEGEFTVVFAMQTVTDEVSRVVPPQWIGAGREYSGQR